jgi:hypothetical protein
LLLIERGGMRIGGRGLGQAGRVGAAEGARRDGRIAAGEWGGRLTTTLYFE